MAVVAFHVPGVPRRVKLEVQYSFGALPARFIALGAEPPNKPVERAGQGSGRSELGSLLASGRHAWASTGGGSAAHPLFRWAAADAIPGEE